MNSHSIEYIIQPKSSWEFGLKELWGYRELLFYFTWRDIKVKYKQTLLGILWIIIQPTILVILLSLSIGNVISLHSHIPLPYPLFALSGLILWNIFSSGLTNAGNSMITHANIIKKIYFPRLILPISAILSCLSDFFVAFVIYLAAIVYYGITISIGYFLLFSTLAIILSCMATLGIGLLIGALNVKYRDFRYVIPFLIQGLLFFTPVIYPIDILPSSHIQYLLALNPMYAAVEIMRYAICQSSINFLLIGASIASSLIFLTIGLIYFKKTEQYFADIA